MLAIPRRTLILFLIVSLGHVLLISIQVQSKSGLPVLEAVAFGSVARVQQGATGAVDAVHRLWQHYLALGGVARENEALARRVVELQAALEAERAIASETHALEDELRLKQSLAQPTMAARVIAGAPSPESRVISIDRGAADGLQADMAVIAVEGIVGRIVGRPAPHNAEVQLLTDHTAAAGGYIERTGAGGVVVGGASNPPLRMLYLANLADVRAGDRVLTSGQDEIFPRGYFIGTIERAERGAGLYRTTAVRPAVDFSHIDVVLVVLSRPASPPHPELPPRRAAPSGGRGGV